MLKCNNQYRMEIKNIMNYIKYIILTALCSAVLIVVICIPIKKTAVPVSTEQKATELRDDRQEIKLTEQDVFKGDLILVNNQVPYHFETEQAEDLLKVYKNKSDFYQVKDKKVKLSNQVIVQLNRMLTAFYNKKQLSTTLVLSGYRNEQYQRKVYAQDVEQHGEQHAMSYMAKPGYSEHHTGFALDFGVQYSDGTTSSFAESENAKWIQQKARNYGFILRYPEEKAAYTGILGEMWHYRYVGVPHSVYIAKNKICLEEYLTFLKNNATQEFPLCITHRGVDYEVFYTDERTVSLPKDVYYTISGDNQNGFIVTTYPMNQAGNVVTPGAIAVSVSGTAVAVSQSAVSGSSVTQ